MTEETDRLRGIARLRNWDENIFVKEIGKAQSQLGMSSQRALAHVMNLFEKGAYAAKEGKPYTLADFAPGKVQARPSSADPSKGGGGGPTEAKAETEGEPEAPQPAADIDPRLADWLESHGFARGPDGYWKQDKAGGDIVKLQIDFSKDPRGMRYGYRLDLSVDPPRWKPDQAIRDYPTLLEYKAFRDKLLTEKRPAPEAGVAKEIPTAEGQVLLQKEAEAIEAKDDDQILAELKGEFKAEVLKQYFYSFDQGGRKVVGLSYKGVKQIARRHGHIEVKELELRETEKAWVAICRARDKSRDLEVYGAAHQPKFIELRSGGKMPDLFALTKAVSKAQRNALRCLISETVVTEAYRAWEERREEFFRG